MAGTRIDPNEVLLYRWRWKEIPRHSVDFGTKTVVAVWSDRKGRHAALLNDHCLAGVECGPLDDPQTQFYVQIDLPKAAKSLMDAQDAAMKDPDLRPGAHDAASHCSEATMQIAKAVGADATPLGPLGGYYQANVQTAKLAKAASVSVTRWQRIKLQDAQDYADRGILVILAWADPSGGHGHTVTVRPDLNNWKEATNPSVAQVGGEQTGNGTMPFRNAFGSDKRDAVKAYAYLGS